jgi:hypothetical protein
MGKELTLKRGTVQKVDTSKADVAITGSGAVLLFMGGSTVPTAATKGWLTVALPIVLPKGVGAYLMAGSVDVFIQGAAYDQANVAETNVFP